MSLWGFLALGIVATFLLVRVAKRSVESPESIFAVHGVPTDEAIEKARLRADAERFAGFRESVLDPTPDAVILEVAFGERGDIDFWGEFIEAAAKDADPAALVVNFQEIPGGEPWNGFGGVMRSLMDISRANDREGSLGPCAVVATGPTNERLRAILSQSKLLPILDIGFFEDVVPARDHLRARRADRGTSAPPG